MNDLQTFVNDEFGTIRSMMIDEAPWFVGRDIAGALGYANTQDALMRHVDDEDKTDGVVKRYPIIDALGRTQFPLWINESGMYSLIFGSTLPSAKRFKHWVTSEVLPAIRRTGRYEATQTEDEADAAVLPQREITNDDYLRAASIVAGCKSDRLPYVLSLLGKAGISVPVKQEAKTGDAPFDRYEILRLLSTARSEYGLTDAFIGRATGLGAKQITFYRTGIRFPRPARAAHIKAVVEPMMCDEADD